MSAEVTFQDEPTADPPPPAPQTTEAPKEPKGNGKPRREARGDDEEKESSRVSPVLKQLRLSEDMSLKEMVDQFGTDGSFSIRISRKWPEFITDATGKKVQVNGYLTKVDQAIDEAWLQEHFGGGTFELLFRQKDAKGKYVKDGSFSRTYTIAGEPSLTELPRAPGYMPSQPQQQGQGHAESPSIINKTFEIMERQLEKSESARGRPSEDPMVDVMREQLRETRDQNERLMQRLEALQNQVTNPPPTSEEKVKDKLLEKMMDQDSARLQAVRMQYESEIRQLKDQAIENEKRLYDRFDRDRQDMRNAHERELALLRTSHETSLMAARSSHETSIAAARASFETSTMAKSSSFDTQKEILQAEIKRLERDNAEIRDDLKELRAKKEKTLVEQVKEIETIKDALGGGDDERSTAEKIVEAVTNPEALAAVGKMFGKGDPAQQTQQQQPPADNRPRVARPQVIRNKETGEKMILRPDGKAVPIKPAPQPGQPQLPQIPEETVAMVVGYLERAYSAGTEPEIVAQSARASVPEPILMAIRDVGGVDAFLTKVAKLPSSSPLSMTQAGRNWVKKVGKALIGE
jgi:hypothetical protein